MKKVLSLLLVLVLCLTLITPNVAQADTVKISKVKATMEVDSILKLKITGTNSTTSWKTSKKAVATVNKTGTVTAKSEGIATITATANGVQYTCGITVVDSNKAAAKSEYSLGETWTVDGLWSLTFSSVTSTDDRNEFSDTNPDQVVVLNYSYSNIGYSDDIMDLFISDVSMKVVDGKGEVADTYPGNVTTYPQETPIGATCTGAQVVYGLNNESDTITVYIEMYDNNYKKHKATFKLKVN